jgi:hypothetical protein
MSEPFDDQEVEAFWEWFAAVAADVQTDVKARRQRLGHLGEMQQRVSAIHPDFKWEIGPYGNGDLFLAISPNGYSDLLPYTRKVVSAAPNISGWQFRAAKPRKDWLRRRLVIRDKKGYREIEFDDWRFRVRMERGVVCIDYDPSPNSDFTDTEIGSLMRLYIESELGEEVVIRDAPMLRRQKLTRADSLSPAELRARFDDKS